MKSKATGWVFRAKSIRMFTICSNAVFSWRKLLLSGIGIHSKHEKLSYISEKNNCWPQWTFYYLIHQKNTRSCKYNKVYVECMKNRWSFLTFKVRAAHTWNKWPCEITSLNSIQQFKSYFKNWFGHAATSFHGFLKIFYVIFSFNF